MIQTLTPTPNPVIAFMVAQALAAGDENPPHVALPGDTGRIHLSPFHNDVEPSDE